MRLYLNISFLTAIQDIYELMCGLHTCEKLHEILFNEMIFGGGRPLSDDSTIDSLIYISSRTKFIETWLKSLRCSFVWHCCAYQDNTTEL